ncbi:MAG TPA: NADH-quinone oxidoreductase subunit NuoG [Candidatus Binatia bacterium]|nr:NADH-quinone oxidoreductase subunit NuoG [Candidatus Binatia bacterium]
MPKMTIDGIEIEVPAGITVLQACELAGKEIPRFCYHERLSVAGNCRMCLVEQEKAPKPIASCAMPVADGMVIKTDTPAVKKARNGVMEFLLINHPLDCPICDQGGECDLQDQAMAYGRGFSRYAEEKRAVTDKDFGPLVKTVMTRCIQCTRCIRFATEIAGTEVLGGTNRGEHLEITTYVEKTIASELSGNLIDVCPVGALTSKPYAFTARPWELTKTDSIDVADATGTNMRLDTRGREVLRVLPRLNEDVNEEWMADKGRYNVDGLTRQRLDRPYIRVDGKLKPASWSEAFDAVAARLKGLDGSKIAALAGDLCDAESMFALKELMTELGSGNLDCRQDGAAVDPRVRASYLFNSTIAGIDKADAILLIGTNPRWESPVINARIRKRYLKGGVKLAAIGAKYDLTYPVEMLGAGAETLGQIANGSHPFAQLLKDAKAPMLIIGMGALARPDGAAILAQAKAVADGCNLIRDGWNGFNVLHTAAARVGGLELGFVPQSGGRGIAGILEGAGKGEIEFLYLLGADEIDPSHFGKAFVVYQGHHGDSGAHRADVVLPGAAYTEKDGTYMNTEGRAQLAMLAIFPPGEAKEDWAILRALSERLGKPLAYDTLEQLRARLYQAKRRFQRLNTTEPAAWEAFGKSGTTDATPFESPIANYYMTDPISRASATMAECTEAFVGSRKKTGTHG